MATNDTHVVVEGDEVRVPRASGREWLVHASSRSGAITHDVAADMALGESAPELIDAIARAMDERNHEAA